MLTNSDRGPAGENGKAPAVAAHAEPGQRVRTQTVCDSEYREARIAAVREAIRRDRYEANESFRHNWQRHVFELGSFVAREASGGFLFGVALGLSLVTWALQQMA